jgi:RNA polymerase sigma-70 factor (ECF subfamily)
MSAVVECRPVSAHSDAVVVPEVRSEELEQYRKELAGYCYRMLGSVFEADDAVQETMVRAWRAADRFEGRSTVRSWLYRIATNVCLDMLRGRGRRARPMDLGPASTPEAFRGATLPDHAWLQPMPDSRLAPEGDPADLVESRETIRLAFVAALQHLPARQRAVLILCEVLRWQATEVAELLDTTVASVNSALQRARATLASRDVGAASLASLDADQQALIARYVDAFERYDMTALVALLHDDAVMSMPPYDFWLRGSGTMIEWFVGTGIGCRGGRLVATTANGCPAFGSYRVDPEGGWSPWAIQVIEVSGGLIVGHHNFVDPSLFTPFGLPEHLE